MVVVIVLEGSVGAADAGGSHDRYRRFRRIHAGHDVLKLMVGQRRFPAVFLDDPETRDGVTGGRARRGITHGKCEKLRRNRHFHISSTL